MILLLLKLRSKQRVLANNFDFELVEPACIQLILQSSHPTLTPGKGAVNRYIKVEILLATK